VDAVMAAMLHAKSDQDFIASGSEGLSYVKNIK